MLGRADVLEDRLLLASVERHEGHVQHLEDARKGSGNGLVADVVLVVVGPGEVVQIRANKQIASVSDYFPKIKFLENRSKFCRNLFLKIFEKVLSICRHV